MARWLALGMAILVAALFLNGAIFSAWVSGGPPNDYPEAWAHRALLDFCFSIAVLLSGVVTFRVIGSFPKIGAFTATLAVLAISFVAIPYGRAFLDSDRCLDSGGRWNDLHYRCER